ncbi:methyltransferase domain-containing protein [Methylocystis iwaonis]|uniref:Methyltransferase n=1 Tax=Methylocystis iwaonis TaxID=2885079 RepID=A0ABM8EFA6_9HYPH|nr:methyltransferase domain-containing protein [Methylocystis iwaonis]BDV36735.1 methyltransferase [Methylocystis iwaonis]
MAEGYLLDNARREAGVRFEALSTLFDSWTFSRIEALGVAPGWRCWEVGAGSATVPNRLAALVGPAGRILASDIDTSWAEGATAAGVEVHQHDVAAEPPLWSDLDLVHARLVLVHVPDRARALRNMVDALKLGGWLMIEDADPALQPLACPDERGPEQALANKVRDGFRTLMKGRGVDLAYGRKLPRLLRDAGLAEVKAEAFFPVAHPASAVLERATIEMLRPQLSAAGLVTHEEIEQNIANIATGQLDLMTAPLITAWGRKL